MKNCRQCLRPKEESEFVQHPPRYDGGPDRICKACRYRWEVDLIEKLCKDCGEIKAIDEFYKRRGRRNGKGRQAHCKSCARIRRDKYPRNRGTQSPKSSRDYRLGNLRRYGLTLETFDAMLVDQGGACAVCAGPAMGKGNYHVDHDHKTGKVRGLLCHKCNVALGMVQDSTEHLSKLIAYLESHYVNSVTLADPVGSASQIPDITP